MPRKSRQRDWKKPASEGWKDPDPGNYKDPQNEPIGVEENNRRATQTDDAIEEFNETFFPKPPPPRRKQDIMRMSHKKRKARFVQSYNARGGNVTYAMIESGITRAEYAQLLAADAEFNAEIEEVKKRIADRAKYCLAEKIGLVRARVAMPKMSDNLLLQAAKALDKEMFSDEGAGTLTVTINVPRPQQRQRNNAELPANGTPDGRARLPS